MSYATLPISTTGIATAALVLYLETGEPVSVRQIAERCGASPSTVRRHMNDYEGERDFDRVTLTRVRWTTGYQPKIHVLRHYIVELLTVPVPV